MTAPIARHHSTHAAAPRAVVHPGASAPSARDVSWSRQTAPRPRPPDVFTPPIAPPTTLTRRERAIEHMLRFVPETDTELRSAIRAASASFSDRQLIRMDQAGVVFAANRVGGLPADRVRGAAEGLVNERSPTIGGRTGGRYLPELRTIQMRSRAEGSIVHEMAHAWDDVRNDRLRLSDAASPELQRRLALQDAGRTAFSSDTELAGALEAYRGRRPRPERGTTAFSLNADPHEPLENPREFYAEGYALFHRGSPERLEVLRRQAPELYRVLYREAAEGGTLRSQPAPP